MKASRLKTEKRVDSVQNRALKIQTFGEGNDQPQKLIEIVEASATGRACVDVYRKFIAGRGFAQADFSKTVVNSLGKTADDLEEQVAYDLAHFGGFAIHVNYNALFEIVSATHIPFEQLRLGELDEQYRCSSLALHPDWGKRALSFRTFRVKDVERFPFFNPDPDVIREEVEAAGGWAHYKGQILYYSNKGERAYPIPVYDAVVTDMSNEEGLSNITQRNVRHGFLPAGMLIDHDNTANSDEQENETKEELTAFQGDEEAGKILYINLQNGEVPPEFVSFAGKNYDESFKNAEAKTPGIIGRAFTQPPILRAEDVGANFGADLMRNAYDFYNSITETERDVISRVFEKIFCRWKDKFANPDKDYSILPKVYRVNATLAERLGNNIDKALEVIRDVTLTDDAKRVILDTVYGLEDDEIDKLLEGLKL